MPSTAKVIPLGDSFFEVIRAQRALGLAGDIKPLLSGAAAAVAGASGRVADAAHQHPALINESADQTNSTLEIQGENNTAAVMVLLPNSTPWAQIWRRQDAGGGDLRLFNALSGAPGNGWWQFFSGPNQVFTVDNGGNVIMPQLSSTLKFVDSSATPAKYLRAAAGQLQAINNGSLVIWALDDPGNMYLFTPTAAVRFQDSSATPLKYINAELAMLRFKNNAALSNLDLTDAGAVIANPRGLTSAAGLQVHSSGALIPAIFVQAATPTEIDGALWFQG